MTSYKYKCSVCGSEQDVLQNGLHELVYCNYCSKIDNNPILMKQLKENTDVNVQLLLEDDHK